MAAFLAQHGPQGRLIPVLLEPTEVPAILAHVQHISALDRDAARVAREIALIAGRPGELKEGDARRLVVGQDLVFNLEMEGEDLRIVDPVGRARTVTPPWRVDNRFGIANLLFDRLSREPVTEDRDRADLVRHASTLGGLLFELLFDEEGLARLKSAMVPGRPRPLITIRSDDDVLLSLPWELLWHDGSFLLHDARIDLARSTPEEVGPEALLREPAGPLKLVVNVSAPEGSHLDYEGESYRITRALAERCRFVPTELGTVEDLVETVHKERPTVIHFSGHGAPAVLAFEDDEGWARVVAIADLVAALRERVDRALPPLFYLASCHGNDPGASKAAGPEEGKSGAESSAARLHREGVPQVVGYDGPIADELSTRAEVAFYRALAEGETTRYAIRQARVALARPFGAGDALVASIPASTHPFAWAQLVLYHRGPDHPLSLPASAGPGPADEALRRTFAGAGDRKILSTGFIGRRSEMHKIRRRLREGERVFVFQGLGGLGKSTLAFHVLPLLRRGEGEAVILWCQEVEQQPDRAEGLVGQLLDFCRKKFGLDWEQVVQQVDRVAGSDPSQRFELFLQKLIQKVPKLVLYLDNLESLLIDPKDARAGDEEAVIGEWASENLGRLWKIVTRLARDGDRLYVVASCRYRNPSFAGQLLPVSPLPDDALYRLMGWFPALRKLSATSRARLVGRLAGHPRAVEYANDLLVHALTGWEDRHGPWHEGEDPEREWAALVEPVLPEVRGRLRVNLLLTEIWDQVLDDRARRMLYRMTLLRRPCEWTLLAVLGEEGESNEAALATAERLRRTSLLEQVELLVLTGVGKTSLARHFTLHPATVQLVRERLKGDEPLRRAAHRRLGERLEAEAKISPDLQVDLEAGYHLFQAGEYDRAYELLGSASDWLQRHGCLREGLLALEPFLNELVQVAMAPVLVERLLGAVGLAHHRLGETEKAIGYHEQALVIDREIGDRQGEGNDLGNLGNVYTHLGELEKAIGYFEQALVIDRETGDRLGEGTHLGNLGNAYADLGELEKAIGYYEQTLVIAREIGDRLEEGSTLGNLGSAYQQLGEMEKAIDYYEQRLVIAREIGDSLGEGTDLGNLGLVYARLGELEKAIGYSEQALEIAREIGNRRGECYGLRNLGGVYALLGETEKAIAFLKQALAIGQAIKDSEVVCALSQALARLQAGGSG